MAENDVVADCTAPARTLDGDHIVIIGPYGNIWTNKTFPTAESARDYLEQFWGKDKWQPRQWNLCVAHVTATPIGPAFDLPTPKEQPHVQSER